MPDHDDAEVLARFRQRMAGIEAHVPEPPTTPPFRGPVSTRALPGAESSSGARTALSLVAAVALVAIAVLAVPLLGRFAPGVEESPAVPASDVAGSTIPPTVPPTPIVSVIPVPTHASPPPGSPQPCPAALIQGRLVADEQWGIAVGVEDGSVIKVIWPYGYASRADGDRMALVDGSGQVVAREGDHVEIGGGFSGGDWFACGGHVAILSGQPTPTAMATPAPSSTPVEPTPLVPGTAGWVGPTRIATEQYEFARLVVDADGYAHVAAVNNNGIFYLTNATGAWTTEQVSTPLDNGYDGDASIIVNEEGSATIVFARYSALRCTLRCGPVGSEGIFMLTNEAGIWSDAVAVIEGGGQEPSLQAADGRLTLAYSRGEFGDRSVFYAWREDAQWTVEEIGEGEAPSLRMGRDGLPRIAYVDRQGRPIQAEAQSLTGPFTIAQVPGEWAARSALLALDADDEPHIVFANDTDERERCGAFHIERTAAGWSDASRPFSDDQFCQVLPESVDGDAGGTLHVISLYDAAGSGVWYAHNATGDFRAWQIREPKVSTDDGPRGVSALDVDSRGRPHILFGVLEAHAYDEDTEGRPDDDGLWYGIGPDPTGVIPGEEAESMTLRTAPPEEPLPSGVLRYCRTAGLAPVRMTHVDGDIVFVALDDGRAVSVVWPHGTAAWLVDGQAVLVWPDGTVVAREGDILDGLGGGLGTAGDAFFVCSVG
jgi:hypothetical protein